MKPQPRHSRDYFDAQKALSGSRQSNDEDNARTAAVSSSAPLSLLLIPSLKEVNTEIIAYRPS